MEYEQLSTLTSAGVLDIAGRLQPSGCFTERFRSTVGTAAVKVNGGINLSSYK